MLYSSVTYSSAPNANDNYMMETVATYLCSENYVLNGAISRTCGPDMQWSGTAPSCECEYYYMHCTFLSLIVLYCPSVIMCDELARPSNGNITFSMGVMPSFGVMTVATYNCHTGYALTGGKNVRVCVGISDAQLGQWNGSEPVCKSKYTLYRKNDLTV